MGHAPCGPQARRGHRHESADRRGPGDGLAADVRQQPLRARHHGEGVRKAGHKRPPAASQPRRQRAIPARLDVQARHRHRRARGRQDHRQRTRHDEAIPDPGSRLPLLGLESARFGSARTSMAASRTRATRSSTSWPGASASTAWRTGRSSTASASEPASTCRRRRAARSRPTTGKRRSSASRSSPGRPTRLASARATTR